MSEPNDVTDADNQIETAPIETPAEETASPNWRRWIWLPLLLAVLWVFNNDGDVDALRERFDFMSMLGGWLLAGGAMIVVFVWALCKILDKVPMPFDDQN